MSAWSAMEYVKLAIFYASWLYFPVAVWLVLRLSTANARFKLLSTLVLAGLSVLAYARFVEPRILLTRRHEIELDRCFAEAGAVRLAAFSDTHLGIFRNAMPASRIAKAVASTDPDAVLIAGDFTYYLRPERFDTAFAALSSIGAPVYAVLGNHDVGLPKGPDIGAPLKESWKRLGVFDVENRIERLHERIEIAGISDLWHGRQDMTAIVSPSPVPRIVVTHHPETALDIPASAHVDLLVAGHTHGGQIYIPFVTCRFIGGACSPHRLGLGEVNDHTVFITAGTGMIGLPMRFMVPPRIDVLDIRNEACADEG